VDVSINGVKMDEKEVHEKVQVSKTETRVRSYDVNGDVVAETITVVTHFEPVIGHETGVGFYL